MTCRPYRECDSRHDCGEGKYCKDDGHCYKYECYKDNQCGWNENCKDHKCR